MNLMDALIAGGWLMIPLLGCSLLATVIIIERLWTLRAKRIAPYGLGQEVCSLVARGQVNLYWLESHSPLGGVLAAGLRNARLGHEQVRARLQEAATAVIHDMERFLSPLGTIAAITPLIGLLGTVVGMIEVFAVIVSADGTSRTAELAGGISRALVTTAAGLTVAIPAPDRRSGRRSWTSCARPTSDRKPDNGRRRAVPPSRNGWRARTRRRRGTSRLGGGVCRDTPFHTP